ncbi:hypothetical protein Vadar_002815 [Vaccinium darrowii]|uniref:Uncharacterized protein n=1 Tax=Vaccinium darrowii TaxID=229202 RepID=A0ACB7X780_9ERIC|nr:hypothetical protein Vadar_002815 [Vaccinium darrowii]
MSSSQTATSNGKNASSVGMKAQWDQLAKECFIHVYVEELAGVGYKAETVLTKVAWANAVKKFNERTGKQYDKVQLKNQWGVLKKDWQLWKNLVLGESGLGRDPDTGAIAASDNWWDLKLMRHPDCAKFREKPLPLEDVTRILFGCNTLRGSIGIPQHQDFFLVLQTRQILIMITLTQYWRTMRKSESLCT